MPLWIHYSQLLFRIYQSTQPGGQHFLTVLNSYGSWASFLAFISFYFLFFASRNACTIKWFRTKRKSGKREKKRNNRNIRGKSNAKKLIWMAESFLQAVAQNPKRGGNAWRRKRAKTERKLPVPARWLVQRKVRHINDYPRGRTQPKIQTGRLGSIRCGKSRHNTIKVFHLLGLLPAGQRQQKKKRNCTNLLNVLVIDLQMSTFILGQFRKGQRAKIRNGT